MKNTSFVLFFLFLFGIVCCPLSIAVDNDYYIMELDMGISIPDDYAVFTKYTNRDNEKLLTLGIDYDLLMESFETKEIYLDACNMDLTFEFLVRMMFVDSEMDNFDTWTDDELKDYGNSIGENYMDEQVTYYNSDVYQHTQTKFLRLYAVDSSTGTDNPFIRYITVLSGNLILIEFISYTGIFTAEQEEFSENIVDSVVFRQQAKEPLEPSQEPLQEETPPFIYEDPVTGVSFTVPANWCEVEFFNEVEFLSKKFANIFDSEKNIMFGSKDFWNTLTAAEKIDMPRSEMNLPTLYEELIDEISEVYPELQITEVNYNNRTYLKLDSSFDLSLSGINISSYSVQLFYMENGFFYFFQVSGPDQADALNTLDTLMESVTYPVYTPTETNDMLSTGNILFWLFALLFTCALFIAPAIIYRLGKHTHFDRKRAITFVVVNALVAGTVSGLLSAFGNESFKLQDFISIFIFAILTGFINYGILTKKRKTEETD